MSSVRLAFALHLFWLTNLEQIKFLILALDLDLHLVMLRYVTNGELDTSLTRSCHLYFHHVGHLRGETVIRRSDFFY